MRIPRFACGRTNAEMLRKGTAFVLLVLVVLPFTAPFQTYGVGTRSSAVSLVDPDDAAAPEAAVVRWHGRLAFVVASRALVVALAAPSGPVTLSIEPAEHPLLSIPTTILRI
jgi:hypothetical protein